MVRLTRFEMRLSCFRLGHVCEAQGSEQSYATVRPAGPSDYQPGVTFVS